MSRLVCRVIARVPVSSPFYPFSCGGSQLQSFVNRCLRRILKISWTDRITNEILWERVGQEQVEIQILRRKWRWIDHTLRKPANSITRQALCWNPQGRGRGVAQGTSGEGVWSLKWRSGATPGTR